MRTMVLSLKPINFNKKKVDMMRLWNDSGSGKLISKHMIMINELIILITKTFVMKVVIIKN